MKKFFFILLFLFAFYSSAYAYFDPGTGSLVLQMLLGGLAVSSLFYRKIIRKIRKLFGNSGIKDKTDFNKNQDS